MSRYGQICNFIGGNAVAAATGLWFETRDPARGEVLAQVARSGAADVDAAVAAAHSGFAKWRRTPGAERARILRRAAAILRERNAELAEIETRDTGKPIQETLVVDIVSGAECLEYFASIAQTLTGEHVDLGPSAFGYVRREPLGVTAGIGAWNYPMQVACWKSAPALACGNAMIFKPSEHTPLTASKLAEIYKEAGLPDGVYNVVHGDGVVGRALAEHPGIAKISLTGSVATGKRVMAAAVSNLKSVTLELGGKSPILIFEDADLDNAVSGALLGNFYSAGEVCSNGTRVFVHNSIKNAFLERLVARTKAIRIGDPLDPETQMGALISTEHFDKVAALSATGVTEGARLVCGGHAVEVAGLPGKFFAPTIYVVDRDDHTIVRDEIFGPVMTVLGFDTEEEAVARANDTDFGLAAGVFTRDITRAHRVVADLEAGTTWINHYNICPIELPFGGVKLSGIGRENSRAAVEHYTRAKSVYVALADVESPY